MNSGDNVTINGGYGSSTISLHGDSKNTVIEFAEGQYQKYIYGFNATSSIKITSGRITSSVNSGNDKVVYIGTNGNNAIVIKDGATTQFDTDNGIIKIRDIEAKPYYLGMNVADTFSNTFDNATISALGGNDLITNSGSQSTISGGAGNDIITNSGNKVTINGDDNEDIIRNTGNNVRINAGNGYDTVINTGDNITINCCYGSSTISLGGESENAVIEFAEGQYQKVIYGFNDSSSIKITSGTITSSINSGNDKIVYIGTNGNNAITIKNGATTQFETAGGIITMRDSPTKPYYLGMNVADTFNNSFNNATINALAGNDLIVNSGNKATISGGAGADIIYNTGDNVTVDAGADNDLVTNNRDKVRINAGNGYDTVLSSGDNVTINGGL